MKIVSALTVKAHFCAFKNTKAHKMNKVLIQLNIVREELKEFTKDYDKSENDLKALQSVGQVCTAL